MSVTINLDTNLFVVILAALMFINGIAKIGLGIAGSKKDDAYDLWDSLDGLLAVGIVILVLLA